MRSTPRRGGSVFNRRPRVSFAPAATRNDSAPSGAPDNSRLRAKEVSMKPLPHVYEVELTGGADGYAKVSTAGIPELQSAPPVDFDGPRDAWSPEHLFLAAIETCLLFTLRSVARTSKIEFISLELSGEGKVDRKEGATRSLKSCFGRACGSQRVRTKTGPFGSIYDESARTWGTAAPSPARLIYGNVAGVRCNPTIRTFHLRLRTNGKHAKPALTACMRKLLVILNAMLHHKTHWQTLALTSSTIAPSPLPRRGF